MKITPLSIKKDKWWIDFTLNGQRIRKTIHGSKRMAEEAMIIEKDRIVKQGYGIQQRKKRIRFKDYARLYMSGPAKENRQSTQDSNESVLKRLNPFFGHMLLDQILPGTIERYKTKRRLDGVEGPTINLELSLMKTIYNKAIDSEEYGIERNPVTKAGLVEVKHRRPRPPLKQEEISTLFKSAEFYGNSLPLFLKIALNTGMRKMETLSLCWDHVDFQKGTITVIPENSKSGKERTIPMNTLVEAALKTTKMASNSPFVFPSPKTDSHIRNIKDVFKKACEKAGIKSLRIHDLRHTAASYIVNDCGLSIIEAMEILGHSRVEMTQLYVHDTYGSKDRKSRGMDKLGALIAKSRQESVTSPKSAVIDSQVNSLYSVN